MTGEDSKLEFFLEERIRLLPLEHIVDFECLIAHRDRVCDSHKTDPVLVLVGFWRSRPLVSVLLGDGEKRTCHLASMEDGMPDILTLILLRIERKIGNLLDVQVFADGSLDDVRVSLFVSSHVRSVRGEA